MTNLPRTLSATGRYFLANNVEDGLRRRVGLETDFTLTYNLYFMLQFDLSKSKPRMKPFKG